MSKQSSPSAQVKPSQASEDETVTPVSHAISLTELAASLEVLNLEADKKTTIVHRTQTDSPSVASEMPRSPNRRDPKKALPVLAHRLKRYGLQMWLEIEIGTVCLSLQKMTLPRSIMLWRLLIEPIQVVQGCTWVGLATCWPSMAEKAAQGPASLKMLQWKPAGLWANSPHGWDALLSGELDVSASSRLMTF